MKKASFDGLGLPADLLEHIAKHAEDVDYNYEQLSHLLNKRLTPQRQQQVLLTLMSWDSERQSAHEHEGEIRYDRVFKSLSRAEQKFIAAVIEQDDPTDFLVLKKAFKDLSDKEAKLVLDNVQQECDIPSTVEDIKQIVSPKEVIKAEKTESRKI